MKKIKSKIKMKLFRKISDIVNMVNSKELLELVKKKKWKNIKKLFNK